MSSVFDPFFDLMHKAIDDATRIPERPLSPPEPSSRELYEQEAAEFMAGEDFDDCAEAAVAFVLDDPDLAEDILRAAIGRDAYGGVKASPVWQDQLHNAIERARQAYIESRA